MDRRVRADQRRALLDEVEARGLTFAPRINKNSARIVERLNRERAEREAQAGSTPLSAASAGGGGVGSGRLSVGGGGGASRPLGRSFLPGHEQETFHPTINARSAALHRPGIDDKDVYSRLYDHGAAARARAAAAAAAAAASAGGSDDGRPSTAPGRAGPSSPTSSGASALRRSALGTSAVGGSAAPSSGGGGASAYPVDEAGEPAPGHPLFFSAVPFEGGGKHDFVLRRLLHTPGGE